VFAREEEVFKRGSVLRLEVREDISLSNSDPSDDLPESPDEVSRSRLREPRAEG